MFDLGWTELLLIGVVALIVVGPKDLPVLFRTLGKFMGKARGMAREFSKAMNDAADDAGIADVAKTFKAATKPMNSAFDGVKDAAKAMTDIKPDSQTGKLSAEREEARKKIELSAAKAAAERKAREAADAAAKVEEMEAAAKPTPSEAKDPT
jgi:sec-independent protein translocase protein TatB